MSKATPSQNNDCGSNDHDEHLCYLMYIGFHLEQKAAYKQLVQNARYRCQRCARTTYAARHVCEPKAL